MDKEGMNLSDKIWERFHSKKELFNFAEKVGSKRITRQLFDGEIYVFEKIVPHSLEYRTVQEEKEELSKHIREQLSEGEAESFDELEKFWRDSASIENYFFFDYGFCLGVRLMAEVFYEL